MPRQNKFIIGHLNLIYEAITSILFIDNYSIMISAEIVHLMKSIKINFLLKIISNLPHALLQQL